MNTTANRLPSLVTVLHGVNLPWREVAGAGPVRNFRKGHLLDMRNRLFYIDKGTVRRVYENENGMRYLSYAVGEGCLCGVVYPEFWEEPPLTKHVDSPMMVTNAPLLSCFEICETPVRVFELDSRRIAKPDFVREHPDLFLNLAYSLTMHANLAYAASCKLAVYEPLQRLCIFLLGLYLEEGPDARPRLTHENLAAFLGVHRSTLSRIIQQLRADGIIGALSHNKLEVLDPAALERLAKAAPWQEGQF